MANQVIEVEADSLESALEQAKAQIRGGLQILSTTTLCDGKPNTVRGVADSTEEALNAALKQFPFGAEKLSEKEMGKARVETIEIEAFEEEAAKLLAKQRVGKWSRVQGIKQRAPGKRGFLGIGKKPGLFEVKVFHPAVVEVEYKQKAKVRIEAGVKREDDRKQRARAEAQRWWKSPQGDRWRSAGGAVCDANSAHRIPEGGGCLCKPRMAGDETPDLVCEDCFDRLSYEPWEPAVGGKLSQAEIHLAAQRLRDKLREKGIDL